MSIVTNMPVLAQRARALPSVMRLRSDAWRADVPGVNLTCSTDHKFIDPTYAAPLTGRGVNGAAKQAGRPRGVPR